MWKRIQQGYGREKERPAQIGNPVLLETTYDEDQLRRNPNVSDAQNSNYRFNAPAQQPYSLSPHDPPNYRASEVPTASSVYSRPSHEVPYEDISPPSSPEPEQHLSASSNQPRRFRSMRDVSPIDENRGRNVESARSNIPVMRKAPPTIQTGETQPAQKFWGGKVAPEGKVRWDEYSGEPSSAGRAGSISPGSYAKGVAPSNHQPLGYQVSISGPEKRNVSFGDRVGRLGVRPPPVETAKHQPWSRATGRSQIAPPLKDQRSTKPLQLPRKLVSPSATSPTNRAADTSRTQHQGRNFTAPPATAVHRVPVGADTGAVADRSPNLDAHEYQIKPTVPLKAGKNSPPRGVVSPISPSYPTGLGIQTPFTPIREQRRDSPDTVIHEQAFSREIPAPVRVATPPQDPVVLNEKTPEKLSREPTSRFSWTTYNSSTTYQHSPPPSPPPLPLPTVTLPRPRVVTEPISAATTASSILSRRRPVPQADRIPESLLPPKPLGPSTPGTAKITTMSSSPTPYSPSSPSAASTFSTATNTYKALPAPPTSLSAADHIAVLESQIEDLRIRRCNVYRLLNDLNNAAPPNPLITDFKRARLVEARKRGFEDELSEIKREEHDVGLKLHRAWKKREREDPGQAGSAIWVRRVTS
ncbi:hypothetical protein CC86DRAFT_196133 [Ophiobolus disseminans]|uniref:Uncharacterized protein n=1 Tax=Ophiobolus disseminans TaxID=1469910 RepID=A0A6A7A5R4_9PLEO|nr:hypothetical protein CC86DRAFT_196133 [Ophiobolus disseminans]